MIRIEDNNNDNTGSGRLWNIIKKEKAWSSVGFDLEWTGLWTAVSGWVAGPAWLICDFIYI